MPRDVLIKLSYVSSVALPDSLASDLPVSIDEPTPL